MYRILLICLSVCFIVMVFTGCMDSDKEPQSAEKSDVAISADFKAGDKSSTEGVKEHDKGNLIRQSLVYIQENGQEKVSSNLLEYLPGGGNINIEEMQKWEYMKAFRENNIVSVDKFKLSKKGRDFLFYPIDGSSINRSLYNNSEEVSVTGIGVLARKLTYKGKTLIIPVFAGMFDNGCPLTGIVYKTAILTTDKDAINSTYITYMGNLRGTKIGNGGGILCRPNVGNNEVSFSVKKDNSVVTGQEFNSNLDNKIIEEQDIMWLEYLKGIK